jgi:enoyl-CoA hydratase/carnithine racemase
MTPHFNGGPHSRQARRRPAPFGPEDPAVSTSYQAIRLERGADGVAALTLNRPEAMNAWNGRMAVEVEAALLACEADDAVRAVVVTGAGRAFCAGMDLGSGGEADAPAAEQRPYPERFWPFSMSKPVIAAINGHAIGVGITFPMTCDIRYVAEDAKLQFAFVRRGMIPELGAHAIVSRVVGLSRAADLLLTGRIFLGREAAELGLVSRALPAAEVLPAALAHAREFRLAAPVSVALSKRLLWDGLGLGVPEVMKREAPWFEWTTRQPDAGEGIRSFLEKREPAWKLRPSVDRPEH